MEITVNITTEHDDGSADAMVTFDKEGLEFLVQEGFISVIEQVIKSNKNAEAGIKLREEMTVSHHKNGKVTNKKVKL